MNDLVELYQEVEKIFQDPLFEDCFEYWKKNSLKVKHTGEKKSTFRKIDLRGIYKKLKKTGSLPENMNYHLYRQTWGKLMEDDTNKNLNHK